MKLQFKQQDFQIQAVKSVVDCFMGQPLKTNRFTLESSKELIRKAKMAAQGGVLDIDTEVMEDIGYRNSPFQIPDSQVLKNIQQVQQQKELYISSQIERLHGVNLGYKLII